MDTCTLVHIEIFGHIQTFGQQIGHLVKIVYIETLETYVETLEHIETFGNISTHRNI